MSDLARRLRALPAFPDDLSVLDPSAVPDDPIELFLQWLDDAIASGERQPHGMTFMTLDESGRPIGRVLILKDVDADGFHVSTHRTSRKGLQLDRDPRAAMLFWWKERGRQVRLNGTITPVSEEASQRDWESRPSYTGAPNPDWRRYALAPDVFEFMQAREDRRHTRLEYVLRGGTWDHAVVETPAG